MAWKNRIENSDFWSVEFNSSSLPIKSKILNIAKNTFHVVKNLFISKPYTDEEIGTLSRTITDLVSLQHVEALDIDGVRTEIKWESFTERQRICLEIYESFWRLKKTFISFTKEDHTSAISLSAKKVVDTIDTVTKELMQWKPAIDYVMESEQKVIFDYDRLINWFDKINKSIEDYYLH